MDFLFSLPSIKTPAKSEKNFRIHTENIQTI